MKLSEKLYKASAGFPLDKHDFIVHEIRNTSLEVTIKITNSIGQVDPEEKAHQTQIAISKLMRLLALITISNNLDFLNEDDTRKFRNEIYGITKQLKALKAAQLEKATA